MALPAPSPAIDAILGALRLARRFCLVIAVGPAGRSTLARYSLQARLEAEAEEVVWHHLGDGDLDARGLAEGSASGRPIVLLSGLEDLDDDARTARLVTMNLRRDEWGELPLRVVLWCARETVDELWRVAPDLLHWRALLQVIEPADLPVYDVDSYLAWCVDAYRETSEDRVLVGGGVLLREPLLLPLAEDPGVGVPFSRWIAQHRRGLIRRGPAFDRRDPARAWARVTALRRLFGERYRPVPVVIDAHEIDAFFAESIDLGETPRLGDGWSLLAGDHVVFVIDDGGAIDSRWAPRIAGDVDGRWIIISDRGDAWSPHFDWPQAVVMAILDPRSFDASVTDERSGARITAYRALQELLLRIFSADELRRFIDYRYPELAGALPGPGASSAGLVAAFVDQLLMRGRVDAELFHHLQAARPRERWAIDEVARRISALAAFA